MDWTTIITAVIAFVGGGGLVYIVNYTEMKRKAGAEADRGVIDNYEVMIERYEKYIANQEQRYEQLEKFHNQRYDELEKRQNENSKKITDLENQIFSNKKFICYDLACKIRQSKSTVPK